jgi:hypothetical protein
VATDDGVPGIPVSTLEISPPESPPTNTPIMVARPCTGSIPKVKGSVSTTAMVIVKPGIAPAISPAKTPTVITASVGR